MKCSPEPDAAQNPKNKTWQPYTHLLGQGNRPSPLATVTHPTRLALTRQAILLYLHAQILVVCLNEMPRLPNDETVKAIGSPGGARTACTLAVHAEDDAGNRGEIRSKPVCSQLGKEHR